MTGGCGSGFETCFALASSSQAAESGSIGPDLAHMNAVLSYGSEWPVVIGWAGVGRLLKQSARLLFNQLMWSRLLDACKKAVRQSVAVHI